ncbi:T9SS type A sorting domain-containing protein [Mariniflexile sp. HNIBRBA6329]|uniref:T9SS type A sorting domain-containing protein n=1 Tax=Mariniflexile sp. HNIBRBA6329 TaxID=3373088 RepID=UPI00374686B5
MKRNTFFITALFTAINFVTAQTTVTSFNTLIKPNHNFGLSNPLYNDSTPSPMSYDPSQVDELGAAFSIDYTNEPGTTGFDGYPSGTVGGFKANNVYTAGNKSACGMPIQIKDLTDNLRFNWKTSQENISSGAKWWATINVIFDLENPATIPGYNASNAGTYPPDVTYRDYDLVIQNVSYENDDFIDKSEANASGNQYWYFAREKTGIDPVTNLKPLKFFEIYIEGTLYKFAVRYKFFTENSGAKSDKVHLKFIPYDNIKMPYFDHSLKKFIDCTKDYIQYIDLPDTSDEVKLAHDKVALDDLWIKSISAGYEVYLGSMTLRNDYFYTTIDNTAPDALTNLVGVNQSGKAVLNWGSSTDSAFDTYTIYRSENGGAYTMIASDLRTNTYTDNTVSNQNYSYYVTAKDRSYNESNASNITSVNLSSSSIVSTTFSTVHDAHVRIGTYANDNYGTNANLQLRETTNTDATRQAFLKFDLTSIDNVVSAVLRLRNTGANTGSVDLNRVADDSWLESTITWNNQPAISANIGTYQFDAVGDFDMDVTTYVNSEIQGDKVVSFALNNASSFMTVSSKEGDSAPQLIISYNDGSTLTINDFNKSEVVVYPNPTNSRLNFNFKNPDLKTGKIDVFDSLGRLVQHTAITSSKMNLELNGLNGIYIVKIKNRDSILIKRIIKH